MVPRLTILYTLDRFLVHALRLAAISVVCGPLCPTHRYEPGAGAQWGQSWFDIVLCVKFQNQMQMTKFKNENSNNFI